MAVSGSAHLVEVSAENQPVRQDITRESNVAVLAPIVFAGDRRDTGTVVLRGAPASEVGRDSVFFVPILEKIGLRDVPDVW